MSDSTLISGELPKAIVDLVDKTKLEPSVSAALKSELKFELLAQKVSIEKAIIESQVDLAKADAASESWFRSYWRPTVGWICVLGFALQYVLAPLVDSISISLDKSFRFPEFETNEIMPLLYGMLGLGVYRTVEKIKGIRS